MTIDFDEIIDRRNTHSAKWDDLAKRCGVSHDDPIPMWVADMDFRAPQSVNDALQACMEHGVHGYYGDPASFHEAQAAFLKRRHGWDIQEGWAMQTHGLVNGLSVCLHALSEPGDGVIVFAPVYHAFMTVIEATGRRVVASPMLLEDNRYHMDIEGLEKSLTGDEKLLFLCSPHNPGGRIWTPEELRALADFCVRNDIILVSDEIHNDLVMPGHKHHVTANVAPDIADRLITLVATSKTFNIAGIETGSVIIADPALRARFQKAYKSAAISPNRFGMIMAEAAYRGGDEWLDALIPYLDRNRRVFMETMEAIPGLRAMDMESTYLGWVNYADTGMTEDEIFERIGATGVVPSRGSQFGLGGDDWLRFNFACRHDVMVEAMSRMRAAFSDLQ